MSNVKRPVFSAPMLGLFLMGAVEKDRAGRKGNARIYNSRNKLINKAIRETKMEPGDVQLAFAGHLKNGEKRTVLWRWLGLDPALSGLRLLNNDQQEPFPENAGTGNKQEPCPENAGTGSKQEPRKGETRSGKYSNTPCPEGPCFGEQSEDCFADLVEQSEDCFADRKGYHA